MTAGALDDYKLDSIYILQTLSNDGHTKRGTCFSVAKDLLLTASHVVEGAKLIKVYLTSDVFAAGQHIEAECIYRNLDIDIAILRLPKDATSSVLELYSTSVSLDSELKICGYPVEKEHYPAPIKVKVTNSFEHMTSRQYSFEISQSDTVSKYSGMSGSPVLYKHYCIGILLVQQSTNTLYALSTKDLLSDISIREKIEAYGANIIVQEGIDYKAPPCPLSPFKYDIYCNAEHPNIKGVDIGFTMKQWNLGDFAESVYDWVVDYCLSYKDKANFKGSERRLFKYARANYPENNLNALADLCLHIAIRESYSTIPIMNKVFDINRKTFSCTHAVLNFDSIELWIGASSVSANVEEAVSVVVSNIEYILNIKNIKNRLIMLTTEIHDSWPHKEKLERLANSELELEERFDKIIIPVFIMHESEIITKYEKEKFKELFLESIQKFRYLFKLEANNRLDNLIDLRIFYFPVSDLIEVNTALLKELNS
ncbi:hypothetical protein WH43_15820 [Rheinheimera sp. KL1]|uniref:Hachiman antiphage defense system protein HamA n=1 Tax=Rheinheimera sp. KL1 TaxID=1635005 RepID=UPI0006A94E54|nr:Hachiman antiphage defense system protein HamA [Rheinheimera sp. KL1]KOO57499.1 hypothetical protein WH43_15820 [Rheinheimera sp. KL1]